MGEDQIGAILQHTIDQGAVTIVFQPIRHVSGALWGFEALSRFSEGVTPESAWAWAARQGLTRTLDRIAVTSAIQASQGLPGLMFVNIAAATLADISFLRHMGHTHRIVWEITESAVTRSIGRWGSRALRAAGYHLAMDDAGRAHSTPERLRWLQPDFVKVDQELVRAYIEEDTRTLLYWVDNAHTLGAHVIAEGVEDPIWIAHLAQAGVDAVQGWAIGRPAAAEDWHHQLLSEFFGGGGG
ncbi:Putative diguanylate phosphodiesterase (EAL domain) with GAF sensor [Sulfobacillus acidophilus TPY]|nr:Putative diguanylate phosphodiesterase (EAL domain) with GAF sensor [Sulfobacillus acidophilus TPY]